MLKLYYLSKYEKFEEGISLETLYRNGYDVPDEEKYQPELPSQFTELFEKVGTIGSLSNEETNVTITLVAGEYKKVEEKSIWPLFLVFENKNKGKTKIFYISLLRDLLHYSTIDCYYKLVPDGCDYKLDVKRRITIQPFPNLQDFLAKMLEISNELEIEWAFFIPHTAIFVDVEKIEGIPAKEIMNRQGYPIPLSPTIEAYVLSEMEMPTKTTVQEMIDLTKGDWFAMEIFMEFIMHWRKVLDWGTFSNDPNKFDFVLAKVAYDILPQKYVLSC